MQKLLFRTTLSGLLSLLILTIALFLISCDKERIQLEPEEEVSNFEAGDLGPLFAQNALETQVFVIDTGDSGMIVGKEGTQVLYFGGDGQGDTSGIDSSCVLVDSAGSCVDLPIELHMIEIYKPGQMIFGQMLPMDDGSVLETVGEVFLQTYKNGGKLTLASGERFGIGMPSDSPKDGMEVFYSASTPGDDVDWSASNDIEDEVTVMDSMYALDLGQQGWIGCQDFFEAGANTITFRSDSIPLEHMKLYVVHKDINAVYGVKDSTSLALANGANIKIMAFAIDAAGTYYEVLDSMEVSASQVYDLKFKTTDAISLAADINGL